MPRKPAVKKDRKKIAKGAGRGPAKQVRPAKSVKYAPPKGLRSIIGWLYIHRDGVALLQFPEDGVLRKVRGDAKPTALPPAQAVAALTKVALVAHGAPEDRFTPLMLRDSALAFAAYQQDGSPQRINLHVAKLAEQARVAVAPPTKRAEAGRRSRAMVDALCAVALGR